MKKRAKKKWIPESIYCDRCKWYELLWREVPDDYLEKYGDFYSKEDIEFFKKCNSISYNHNRKDCCMSKDCEEDCSNCKEIVSKCNFLNYIEYGPYPLGDGCKVCRVKDSWYHTKHKKKKSLGKFRRDKK